MTAVVVDLVRDRVRGLARKVREEAVQETMAEEARAVEERAEEEEGEAGDAKRDVGGVPMVR